MEARTHAARLAWYDAAARLVAGQPVKQQAAIAKLVASNAAMDNARDATQIFGGYGFMNEFPVGRFYRDAKVLEIGEGTSEVQRMIIARELGPGLEGTRGPGLGNSGPGPGTGVPDWTGTGQLWPNEPGPGITPPGGGTRQPRHQSGIPAAPSLFPPGKWPGLVGVEGFAPGARPGLGVTGPGRAPLAARRP